VWLRGGVAADRGGGRVTARPWLVRDGGERQLTDELVGAVVDAVRYSSEGFTAELTADDDGLVVTYGDDLWRQVGR
jgi:hypothetical protein